MTTNAREKRKEVARLREELERAKGALESLIRNCTHKWGEPVAAHIHTGGYTIAGDPPGTMGIDRQFDCYVPAETKKRWKRTCANCGEEQFTTDTDKHVTETPKFYER